MMLFIKELLLLLPVILLQSSDVPALLGSSLKGNVYEQIIGYRDRRSYNSAWHEDNGELDSVVLYFNGQRCRNTKLRKREKKPQLSYHVYATPSPTLTMKVGSL